MSRRMLIDASHPEETRVVVLDGHKVEEFDFESASRRPLKGNIYLAKVTRVEPSLQAAFVEYGGNRQGFLAFSEIHPDYYQIPVADRMALIADQTRRLKEEDEDVDSVATAVAPALGPVQVGDEEDEHAAHEVEPEGHEGAHEELAAEAPPAGEEAGGGEHREESFSPGGLETDETEPHDTEAEAPHGGEASLPAAAPPETVPPPVQMEATGIPVPAERRGPRPRPPRRRQYKIQEVIRRKQVILVQVVKEERGNKGASLTTYLSLAGRYCVLMPNTPRGGGISRKITSGTDRRRLKSAAQSLELPEGMGLIIRTAGANRTKTEIKRDYEYLLRLWDSVRELTLKSNAPALVYEEGNLIKRAIRDLYGKEISEILVDGDDGYHDAKDFMRMLMPSHAKNVKLYKESLPLFQHYHVEAQLDAMFSPTVTLRSGGYVVINQTEALVSIDVNSGKATREHSIEETAHKTNLEAADEIARQLRLRDLAGLIVIDFIDMEDAKNDRNVEKRLRDAVRGDRARVQIGKISQFGLLEMSRQRLRAGVLAGSTIVCPHCAGAGFVRSTESAALRLLRTLDEEGQRQPSSDILVRAREDVVIYMLNHKRREIARIEDAYNLLVRFETSDSLSGGTFEIERTGQRAPAERPKTAVSVQAGFESAEREEAKEAEVEVVEIEEAPPPPREPRAAEVPMQGPPEVAGEGRRRRRGRRRGGRGRGHGPGPAEGVPPVQAVHPAEPQRAPSAAEMPGGAPRQEQGAPPQLQSEEGGDKRRRRRRRGHRGRRREGEIGPSLGEGGAAAARVVPAPGEVPQEAGHSAEREQAYAVPEVTPNAPSAPQWSFAGDRVPPPRLAPAANIHTEARAERPAAVSEPESRETTPEPPAQESEPAGEARKGWWQRRFKI